MHRSDPTDRTPIAESVAPPPAAAAQPSPAPRSTPVAATPRTGLIDPGHRAESGVPASAPTGTTGSEVATLDSVTAWAGGIGGLSLTLAVVVVVSHRVVRGAVHLVDRVRSRSDRTHRHRSTREHPVVPVALLTGLGAVVSAWIGPGTAGAATDSGSQQVDPVAPTSAPVLDLVDDSAGAADPGPRRADLRGTDGTATTPSRAPASNQTGTTSPPDTPPPTAPPPVVAPGANPPSATPPPQPDTGRSIPEGLRQATPPPATSADDAVTDGTQRRVTHTVRPGEHFWRIASDHLEQVTGTPPEDHAVVDYWLRLIAANVDRLPDPDDPDLIHPGLELVLPETGPAGITSR